MSISKSFFSLSVSIATAHVKQNDLGFLNSSYFDESSNMYIGSEIEGNQKGIHQAEKLMIGAMKIDEHGNIGIELVDRSDFLSGFSHGVNAARSGEGIEYSSYCSCPVAFLAGYKHYNNRLKHGGMAYRLEHGRVCHGMVCEDTNEVWF
ncbi:MAG: hypothetical protein ACRC6N_11370 [Plesiomonas sp.]|uniref:hypothetical protein n=1 Tax=Plesiomonas sp. TaxID=2486279 RepID=UPI003F29F71F